MERPYLKKGHPTRGEPPRQTSFHPRVVDSAPIEAIPRPRLGGLALGGLGFPVRVIRNDAGGRFEAEDPCFREGPGRPDSTP